MAVMHDPRRKQICAGRMILKKSARRVRDCFVKPGCGKVSKSGGKYHGHGGKGGDEKGDPGEDRREKTPSVFLIFFEIGAQKGNEGYGKIGAGKEVVEEIGDDERRKVKVRLAGRPKEVGYDLIAD